ncbi:xanthine dehydrogenase family protein molybdopterin-binding subunit [Nonomuraea sp. NPDC005650]|uniref:xanthine dehydrogenase family protein molybdopterin-binding subunit n=1 Tax=Nonomuraea sp. NPDC005650 TaxID=3157045 RepID=UPI0033ADE5F4
MTIQQTGVVGRPVAMVDADVRVTGKIDYVINLDVPDMCHAAVHRSDRPHALIRNIDLSAALTVAGVVGVLTRADFAPHTGVDPYYGSVIRDQPVVAIDKVRYVGEPVAVVAASTEEAAREAAALIKVEYEDLDPVYDVDEALADPAPLLHDRDARPAGSFVTVIPVRSHGGNVCNRFALRHGDVERGLAEADHVFEDVFTSPAVAHVAMEPHVAVAWTEGDRLVVWSSTQTPYAVQHELAGLFDLPHAKVQVKVPSLGGGYGGKVYAKIEPIVAALTRKLGRPVKLTLSRAEDMISLTKHAVRITLTTGVTSDGRLVARRVRALYNAGAYADISPRLITNGGAATPGPYRTPNVEVESYAVYTNLPPAGAFRGFGVTQAAWAYERQLDMIAGRLGLDPIELRLRNLLREGEQYPTGETLHDFDLVRVLSEATAAIGAVPLDQPADPRRRRGRGCAVIMKATVTPTTSTAWVKMERDGSIDVLTSTVEMGQGSRTVLAQIAADALAVDLDHVRMVDPDTDVTPFDQSTTSSRSTYSMGHAVELAVADVRGKLLHLAAELLESPADALELHAGTVRVRDRPEVAVSYRDALTRTLTGSVLGSGSYVTKGGLDPETGQGIGSVHWHQGAGAAEVEVDRETGKITVLRYHSAVYAGRVINPATARLQVQGSAMFGLGQALFEELKYDDGRLLNANLDDYRIPAFGDVPGELTATLLEAETDPEVHGIGETALPPVIPAIANAVRDAVGVELTDAPFTAERVLEALDRLEEPHVRAH